VTAGALLGTYACGGASAHASWRKGPARRSAVATSRSHSDKLQHYNSRRS
jgi:hypothetical protein